MKIFENLKVVELSSVLAGPLVGTFFAELGAEVLKIENPITKGDVTRSWKLPVEADTSPISAYYAAANFGKTTIFKDLKEEIDYKDVLERIATADVVLVNFKPGDAKKLHVEFETLIQLNPGLIYGEIIGFEENDPRVAYDVVLQAETGFMSMNGSPDTPPLKMPIAMIDILASHQLKEGILCALIQRSQDGKGRKVQVSLFETAIASLANQAANWLTNHQIPQRIGSLHPNIAPYGETFQTADGEWLVLAIGSDRQFEKLCHILSLPELSSDPRFHTNEVRVKNRNLLKGVLQSAFLKQSQKAWKDLLLRHHIPFGAIKNLEAVFQDPQAQQLIVEQQLEGSHTKSVKTVSFKIRD